MKLDATTLLILAAVGVGAYLILRPTPAPVPVQPVYNPALYGGNFVSTTMNNPTSQDITAGGQAVSSVISALSQGGVI
jgi:hypothetical protein